MPNIPSIKIGNTTYNVKDTTAREHLVEVSTTQPSSPDNRLWIKDAGNEYEIPTYGELTDLKSAFTNVEESIGYVILKPQNNKSIATNGATPILPANIQNESANSCLCVPCVPGDVFVITGTGGNSTRLWAFSESDGTRIVQSDGWVTETNKQHIAPENAAYFAYNGIMANPRMVYKGQKPIDKFAEIDAELVALSYLTPIYERYTITEARQSGALLTDGNISETTDVYRYYIPVTKGQKMSITSQHGYSNYKAWLFVNSSNSVVGYYPSSGGGVAVHRNIEQVAPADGYLVLQDVYGFKASVAFFSNVESNDVLYHKSVYNNGDSVAYGAGGVSYAEQIAQIHTMGFKNDAVSGTTLRTRSGRTDSICERVLALTSSDEYDFYIIEGGYNDYFNGGTIGSLTSDYSSTPDSSTVIGAVEAICKHLRTNFSDKKYMFVLGHRPIGVGQYDTGMEAYWNAIASALEKWAVPYVNILKDGTLMAYNADWLADYFGTGETMGTHPNTLGYKLFYVPIVEAKMKSI